MIGCRMRDFWGMSCPVFFSVSIVDGRCRFETLFFCALPEMIVTGNCRGSFLQGNIFVVLALAGDILCNSKF